MWIPFSTPSTRRSRRNRTTGLAVAGLLVLASPVPAGTQQVVFDPRNHLENALQAARQLESLANEARSQGRIMFDAAADCCWAALEMP